MTTKEFVREPFYENYVKNESLFYKANFLAYFLGWAGTVQDEKLRREIKDILNKAHEHMQAAKVRNPSLYED